MSTDGTNTAQDEQLAEGTLLSHLVELRERLLKISGAILLVFICLLPFSRDIFELVSMPLREVLPGNAMIATAVASPLLTPFKLTFFTALFVAMPVVLYQVWALMRTIEECCQTNSDIPMSTVRDQADQLIMSVIEALEGDEETIVVKQLLVLRRSLDKQESGQALNADTEASRAEVKNLVNNFFFEKMTALPEIKVYMDEFKASKK